MPLSAPDVRREIHHRLIDMRAFAREDGLYDVEGHLRDIKPFDFERSLSAYPTPAGEPLHDFWIRMSVDSGYVVRKIEASSDVTPFGVCKGAESTLSALLGERIARGWSSLVKERLRGAASCTHLMEMLIPMGTTALQGVRALNLGKYHAEVDRDGLPLKIDSCYAFARGREVVMKMYPQHYRPSNP